MNKIVTKLVVASLALASLGVVAPQNQALAKTSRVKKYKTKKASKNRKKLTMAQKYKPVLWKGIKSYPQYDKKYNNKGYRPYAEWYIKNWGAMPKGTKFHFVKKLNMSKLGKYKSKIKITFPDRSSKILGPISFRIKTPQAKKYPFKVKNAKLKFNSLVNIRKDFIDEPVGYFPNDPATGKKYVSPMFFELINYSESEGTNRPYCYYIDTQESNRTFIVRVKAQYPDGTVRYSRKFPVTVLPAQKDLYPAKLRSSTITISRGTDLSEGDSFRSYEEYYEVVNPNTFLTNSNRLPKGTMVCIGGDVPADAETSEYSGTYNEQLVIVYPDTSVAKLNFKLQIK